MIEYAREGLRAIFSPPSPTACTYVEGSVIGIVAIMVAVAVVPDAIFLWLLMPHHLWWLALALDAADIYGALWLLGLYGTMALRPHTIEGERITLRDGALRSFSFDRSAVVSATPLGHVKRRKLPRKRGDASLVLAQGGVPVVDIRFNECVDGFLRVFVASDRPDALVARLTPSSSP